MRELICISIYGIFHLLNMVLGVSFSIALIPLKHPRSIKLQFIPALQ